MHYHFVSDSEFDRMVEEDDFYEWAHVFGHRYGTPKGHIRNALKDGQDFLFDIDWQGTQQLYQKDQQDTVSVFILPPSIEALRERLEGRGTDTTDVIDARMERAKAEISHWAEYDYVVINDDLERVFRQGERDPARRAHAPHAADRPDPVRARTDGTRGFRPGRSESSPSGSTKLPAPILAFTTPPSIGMVVPTT